jgi:5'-nucleotidase
MSIQKPSILITNDDGVHAQGIKTLYNALEKIADVTVVAPLKQQSGKGASMSLHSSLTLHELFWNYPSEPKKVWAVEGTPADCVKIGLDVVLQQKPDFVISGINHSSNAGRNILYSGTIGAIIESVMQEVPGIAFSSLVCTTENFNKMEDLIRQIVSFLSEKHCEGTLFNVNFPIQFSESFANFKFASQGKAFTFQKPKKITDNDYILSEMEMEYPDEKEDSDIRLLRDNYVTCVPINVFDFTNYRKLRELKANT